MTTVASGARVFLVIALVLAFGACAGVPSLAASHLEGSEACCGLVDCSALTISLVSLMVPVVAASVRYGAAPSGRSAALQPIPPPPEPLLFGAA